MRRKVILGALLFLLCVYVSTDSFVKTNHVGATTQDDMGTGGDAGNTIENATLIEAPSGNGYGGFDDQYDWYKIPVVNGQTISIEMSSNTGFFYIQLFDTNQQKVDQATHEARESQPPVSVSWTATKSGFFYFKVKHEYFTWDTYSLEITGMTPPNESPEASFEWWIDEGTLYVNASGSSDIDGEIVNYMWFFDGVPVVDSVDGCYLAWGSLVPGVYELSLEVVDDHGATSDPYTLNVEIEAPMFADAWIEDVDYTENVEPGGLIIVNISVGWEFSSDTTIGPGIYNLGQEYYEVEVEDTVSGTGSNTYTLEFEAPFTLGLQDYLAETPYWSGEDWVWGNESRFYFSVRVGDPIVGIFEITDLQYPSSVRPGAEISIKVIIDYELSNTTEVACGVTSLNTTEILAASIITLSGQGTRTFNMDFLAPQSEGTYNHYVSVGLLDGEPVEDTFQITVSAGIDQPPEAYFEWWMEDGHLYLDAAGSTDDGEIREYRWYVDGEHIEDALYWDYWSWSFMEVGVYEISLKIVDDQDTISEPYTLMVEIEETDTVNQPPEASFEWWIDEGTLYVDASGSSDIDGEIVNYVWFVDGEEDASFEGEDFLKWTDMSAGTYSLTLRVYDNRGDEDTYRVTIEVPGDEDDSNSLNIPGFPIEATILGLLAVCFALYQKKPKEILSFT